MSTDREGIQGLIQVLHHWRLKSEGWGVEREVEKEKDGW